MAKIMKDTRKTIDVDTELENIKKSNEKTQTKLDKDSKKKKEPKKKDDKKATKNKKTSFFKEVKNEMSKVKWPSKKDMFKYSVATILFIIFFALFFYLIDLVMALLREVF